MTETTGRTRTMADNKPAIIGSLDPSRISHKDYTNSLAAEAHRAELFTDADIDRIRADLMNCLAEVIGYYTKGESSSVKAETARKLSLSMLYNIDTYLISLGDDMAAVRELGERRMSELYGKGYLINSKLFEEAKVLYGKVRFTRLKDGGAAYDRTIDKYFYNYLSSYDPRFTAQDKIFLSLRRMGVDGAFHIDGAVDALKKLLLINSGRAADVIAVEHRDVTDDSRAQ